MDFTDFLHWRVAEKYALQHAAFPRISDEVSGSHEKMRRFYVEDTTSLERFRSDLWQSTSPSEEKRAVIAKKWSHYLSVRKAALSFWSSAFVGAYLALIAGGAGLFVVLAQITEQEHPVWVLAFFAITTIGISLVKFYLERKAFWYEFVRANLEEILSGKREPSVPPDVHASAVSPAPARPRVN